uniref:ADP-ribosylhydrolase ARH3 n=1 Tax=Timema bartmani TaxID=61472 RepID=A0A7R9F3R5_9NEOP|nr:unnamed protein product [Timema bartmani]
MENHIGKTTPSSPERDSNTDLPVLGNLAQHISSALANHATKVDDPFRRTLQYAISLGGDTDTIASMAGAIAGAFYGYEAINTSLQKHCELLDQVIKYADDFFKLISA